VFPWKGLPARKKGPRDSRPRASLSSGLFITGAGNPCDPGHLRSFQKQNYVREFVCVRHL